MDNTENKESVEEQEVKFNEELEQALKEADEIVNDPNRKGYHDVHKMFEDILNED